MPPGDRVVETKKGVDDGRRFPPEAVLLLKRRVSRYRHRLRLSWLGFARLLRDWDRLEEWFPWIVEEPADTEDDDDADHAASGRKPQRVKDDRDWPITERALFTWIVGDTSRGNRVFTVPDLPKLQAIASFMVEKKAVSARMLSGSPDDFRFVSELWDQAGIVSTKAMRDSWIGRYVGRIQNGDHWTILVLEVHWQADEATLFTALATTSGYKRRAESRDAFLGRLLVTDTPQSTMASGWAIPVADTALLALLRMGAVAGGSVIPWLFKRQDQRELGVQLVWAADGSEKFGVPIPSNSAILIFEKEPSRDEPDFELKRPSILANVLASIMTNSSRIGVVPATTQLEIDLLGSSWAGDAIGIQQCLDEGVNVNIYKAGTFQTPLHLAIMARRLDAVELLLAQPGIRIDVDDNEDRTPSELALVFMGDEELSQRLADLEEAEYERDQSSPPRPSPRLEP
jgi:hypothetical protein